jgi:hypothetical protein
VGIVPGLTALVRDRTEVIATFSLYTYVKELPIDVLHTAAALFGLTLALPVTLRLGVPSGLFVVVTLVPPLLAGGMLSIGRMTSIVFPLFIWLGATVPSRWRDGAVMAFALGQGLIAALFFSWRAVY